MIHTKTILAVLMALVELLLGMPAHAAGQCSGLNVNTMIQWEPNEIGKGVTLTTFRHTSVTVSDDASAPYHLIAGECVGALLTAADGIMRANGSCARKDKDGDVLNEEWVLTPGTEFKGTLKQVGGTGKFANSRVSAQWHVSMTQGKMAAVRWTGSQCP